MSLEIKTNKRWKYSDVLCVGCAEKEETMDEILMCQSLNYENSKRKSSTVQRFFQSKCERFGQSWSGNNEKLKKEESAIG